MKEGKELKLLIFIIELKILSFMTIEPDGEDGLTVVAVCADDPGGLLGSTVPADSPAVRQVLAGEPVFRDRPTADTTPPLDLGGPHGPHMLLPLTSDGTTLGVLSLARAPEAPPYSVPERANATQFAQQAALALLLTRARRDRELLAVLEDRDRIARDLHDLLGYSLSTITLKSELIHRLIPANPDRAREEVAGVLGVSRQALADVRLVASGYREMSLETEAEAVTEVMTAADVRVETDIDCGRLHPLVDTVLATALREGITNILRHSKVQSCEITAAVEGERVRLTLVNDGVTRQDRPRVADGCSGSGLGNLRTRLAEIGGTLTTVTKDGRFRLVAEAPVRPAVTEAGARNASAA